MKRQRHSEEQIIAVIDTDAGIESLYFDRWDPIVGVNVLVLFRANLLCSLWHG